MGNQIVLDTWKGVRSNLSHLHYWVRQGDPYGGGLETTQPVMPSYRAFLKELDQFLTSNGFEYWLDMGTLLGCIRHQKMIPWDYDLDFAMTTKYYNALVAMTSGEKFTVGNLSFGYPEKCSSNKVWCVYYKEDFWVDIYDYEQRGELLCPALSLEDRWDYPCYSNHHIKDIFPLKRAQMWGEMYPVPANAEKCLTEKYGDWKKLPRVQVIMLFIYHRVRAYDILWNPDVI